MIKENKRQLKIGNEIYHFKMTNQTIFDIDEKFGNYGEVINGFMESEKLYCNAVRILSCCCIDTKKVFNKFTRENEEEKIELTARYIIDNLTPSQISTVLVDFVYQLYSDYVGTEKIEEKEENDTDKKKEN